MQIHRTRAMAVLSALALGAGLVACAGTGERLPRCTGKPVPIHGAPVATRAMPARPPAGVGDAH